MKNHALYQLGLRDTLAALRAKHFSAEEYCAQLQRRIAERAAWAAPGVNRIEDNITVI